MQQEPNKMKPNQKDELEKKTDNEFVRKFAEEKYKYGFTTEVHTDIIERGLNEEDRKSTRLNSSHSRASRMPSSA